MRPQFGDTGNGAPVPWFFLLSSPSAPSARTSCTAAINRRPGRVVAGAAVLLVGSAPGLGSPLQCGDSPTRRRAVPPIRFPAFSRCVRKCLPVCSRRSSGHSPSTLSRASPRSRTLQRALALERQLGLRNAYLSFIFFARIYVLANKPDEAIDQLEETLRRRDFFSRGWLRIDSTFTPLRANPRFQRLVSSSGSAKE